MKYFVRPSMVLHRIMSKKIKTKLTTATKIYQEGEEIEAITDPEIIKYQHLIESDEQQKKRAAKTKLSVK